MFTKTYKFCYNSTTIKVLLTNNFTKRVTIRKNKPMILLLFITY